jgi:hypothetical protein
MDINTAYGFLHTNIIDENSLSSTRGKWFDDHNLETKWWGIVHMQIVSRTILNLDKWIIFFLVEINRIYFNVVFK